LNCVANYVIQFQILSESALVNNKICCPSIIQPISPEF
jgi:hypothetical protein